jgi:hypothetical protein
MAGEDPGREPAEAGVLAGGVDAVFDTGVAAVAGFEVLDRPVGGVIGWGVGGHDLMARAFDGVEQGSIAGFAVAVEGRRSGAFLGRRSGPSTSQIIPDGRHPPHFRS